MEQINQSLPPLQCERCLEEDLNEGADLYETDDQTLICKNCIEPGDGIIECQCGEVIQVMYDDQTLCGKCLVKEFKNDMFKRFFAESDKETKRDMLAWVYDQRIDSDELLDCAVEGFIGKLELNAYFSKLNPWEVSRFQECITEAFQEEAHKWLLANTPK